LQQNLTEKKFMLRLARNWHWIVLTR